MRCHEFVYVGDLVYKVTEQNNAAFLLQYQTAILSSLRKRKLINQSQYERCIEELEKQYNLKDYSQA